MRYHASRDGKGHVVYQLKDGSKPDRIGNRVHIRYASKVWEPSLHDRPPYYLVGDAMIDTIEDGSRYARATKCIVQSYREQLIVQHLY